MNPFLKITVVVALVGLFVSGLLSVLTALFSRISPSLPLLRVAADDEDDYEEHETLRPGGERDRAAHS